MKHFNVVTNHSPVLHCKIIIKSPKPQQCDGGLQQPLNHLFLTNSSIFREGRKPRQFWEEILLHNSVVFQFLCSSLLFCCWICFFPLFFWNQPFCYGSEEEIPWEDEGSSVVVQEGKPSEQVRNTPREAVLRAPQPFGSCQAVQIPIAFKHTVDSQIL